MTTISFGSNYDHAEYKLFELDPELENQLLNKIGSVVHLKGAVKGSTGTSTSTASQHTKTTSNVAPPRAGSICDGGHVVLCGNGTTQQVRCGESSNLVLLVSDTLRSKDATNLKIATAVGSTQKTFVLSTVPPRLDHLHSALNEFVYVPPLNLSSSSSSSNINIGVTMDTLESRVQASREEILSGLKLYNIPSVPGTQPQRWCKLESGFVMKCFDSILSVIETHDWNPTKSIPVKEVVELLSEHYASWVVEHVLRTFSTDGCSGNSDDIALSVQATRVFRAEQVLVESKFGTSTELARDWENRLPKGVGRCDGDASSSSGGSDDGSASCSNFSSAEDEFVNIVKSEGLGLIEDGSGLRKIRTFLRRNLSSVTKTRFQQLFEARAEWKKEDLLYYLVGLDGGESLLVKWARGTQGGTIFSKR